MTAKSALIEAEWAAIKQVSQLPATARPAVETAVGIFRAFEHSNKHSAHRTRAVLQRLSKRALVLRDEIADVLENPEAHYALTVPDKLAKAAQSELRRDAQHRFDQTMTSLEMLAHWLSLAARRVPPMRTGANRRAGNILWLVKSLDVIWKKFTGTQITRSKKRNDASRNYITTVCKIASRRISDGSIEHAMQRRIQQRRRDKITPSANN